MNALPNSQKGMFQAARRTSAIVNTDFLWLVKNGMTKEDLERNIERRPSLWARFEKWVDQLPSNKGATA